MSQQVGKDLPHYRAETGIDKDMCPLEWSRKCAPSHGLVVKLAFKYLVFPATTVPYEQLFSLYGHIVNANVLLCLQTCLPKQLA